MAAGEAAEAGEQLDGDAVRVGGVAVRVGRAPPRRLDGEREEVRWRRWLRTHDDGVTDAVIDRDDWMPSVVEAGAALYECARHPRSTWRAARRG